MYTMHSAHERGFLKKKATENEKKKMSKGQGDLHLSVLDTADLIGTERKPRRGIDTIMRPTEKYWGKALYRLNSEFIRNG